MALDFARPALPSEGDGCAVKQGEDAKGWEAGETHADHCPANFAESFVGEDFEVEGENGDFS